MTDRSSDGFKFSLYSVCLWTEDAGHCDRKQQMDKKNMRRTDVKGGEKSDAGMQDFCMVDTEG